MSDDDGPGAREVAYRLFAAEFDDASLSYSESDEERAPNYVVTPTGARVNRLFAAGVLTEVEHINDDTRRGRVVDPTGAFVTYAGQYQPDAQTFLERADPPSFVALTGKARTFEPEDSDRVFTSVRPESINHVDADVRDRWIVTAAETTLDRLAVLEKALAADLRGEDLRRALEAGGAPASLAAGIPRALEHYRTSPAYVEAVRLMAVDALELVAGDRDEVRAPDVAPDEGGHAEIGPLPETDVSVEPAAVTGEAASSAAETETEPEADVEATAESDPTETAETEPEPTAEAEPEAEIESEAEAEAETEPETTTETETEPAEPETAEPATAGGADETTAEEPLGDFDESLGDSDADASAAGSSADSGVADTSDAADTEAAGGEMYELDDEEREEIESEYGTEFETGGEVEEAGIDVPDADDLAEELEEQDAEPDETATEAETDSGADAESEAEADGEEAAEDAEDVDLTAAAVETMRELDDGDGADREAVAAAVVDEYGADPEDVDDAIEDALMGGQCYEPTEGTLKAI
ncbi:RPA family protein [Haloparvum sedimenti]|uniref:RPA family protein n=1 Tax=Haloparvum sedimenti TaxID=1678448 RepID=UPI00071E7ED9|nr:hypothetical protein [Haloparvum sedimenti]